MTIYEVMNLLKIEWKYAAMDKNGVWRVYREKPKAQDGGLWKGGETDFGWSLSKFFEIEKPEQPWTKCLVERNEK